MARLLDGAIARIVAGAFRGKLKVTTLRKPGRAGGLDDNGDAIPAPATTYSCEGYTDEYTAYFRAVAGIPQTDSKVCIIAGSLPRGIAPGRDDQVYVGGKWYQLREANTDPATALWECQAYEIPEPVDVTV